MQIALAVHVHTEVTVFPQAETGRALEALRSGIVRGAAVVLGARAGPSP